LGLVLVDDYLNFLPAPSGWTKVHTSHSAGEFLLMGLLLFLALVPPIIVLIMSAIPGSSHRERSD